SISYIDGYRSKLSCPSPLLSASPLHCRIALARLVLRPLAQRRQLAHPPNSPPRLRSGQPFGQIPPPSSRAPPLRHHPLPEHVVLDQPNPQSAPAPTSRAQ